MATEEYFTKIRTAVADSRSTLDQIDAAVSAVAAEAAQLASDLATAQAQAGELRQKNDSLQARVGDLTRDNEALRLRIRDLEDQLKPKPPEKPDWKWEVPLEVRETAGIARAGEIASMGVPLGEDLGITSIDQLAVRGDQGRIIPADFRPTAWWNTAKAAKGAFQWVQVSFRVDSLPANGSRTFTLLGGLSRPANPEPATKLSVQRGDDGVTVDTGAARFRITGTRCFDEVELAGQENVIAGSQTSATFQVGSKDVTDSPATVRKIEIEYAGPLVAFVVTEAVYPSLAMGGGNVTVRRRYELRAGSGMVLVGERHTWEGSLNGTQFRTKSSGFNGILGRRISERLRVDGTVNRVLALDRIGTGAHTFDGPVDVRLEQEQRPQRLRADGTGPWPTRFTLTAGGSVASEGDKATGGLLAVQTAESTLAVGLRQMHRYEPQALGFAGGEVAVELASGNFWLAHHQGVHVSWGLAAFGPEAGQAELEQLWGALNRPLRAMPSLAWINGTEALAPVPDGPLPGDLAAFDEATDLICRQTLAKEDEEGISGLMTFGLFPRLWGASWKSPEMGSGSGGWDDLYLKFTVTDYWCTSKTAWETALRQRAPHWLDEISLPAAWRMLHTQIFHGAPADNLFFLGQSPAGYGGYRADFNSCHQYWEPLFLYYFMTGDRTVVETVERGARRQVEAIRTRGTVSGRAPHQWMTTFRFLSHTSQDGPAWGAAFEELMARSVQDHYVEVETEGGVREAFWLDPKTGNQPATHPTHTLYSIGFYDMENLWFWGLRTGNAPVNGRKPWDLLVDLARTAVRQATKIGDGTVAGKWARIFEIEWDGQRAVRFTVGEKSDQAILFPDDKPGMAAWLARAASLSGDPQLAAVSRELARFAIARIQGHKLPMGKLMGLCASRLATAVALEAKRGAAVQGEAARTIQEAALVEMS